jgi:hypothetical protein
MINASTLVMFAAFAAVFLLPAKWFWVFIILYVVSHYMLMGLCWYFAWNYGPGPVEGPPPPDLPLYGPAPVDAPRASASYHF